MDSNQSGMAGIIDSTTRAVDFWLDNIFTDLNVRSRIRSDKEQLKKLLAVVQQITARLENNKTEIQKQLGSLAWQKNELIISDRI